jgi:hypothetical protein
MKKIKDIAGEVMVFFGEGLRELPHNAWFVAFGLMSIFIWWIACL